MAKKGLNMEKVVEIRNEVEEVMENTSTIVTEMAEHVGASLEDIDALREMCVEEFEKELELVQEREENRMKELKNKVDNGIKYAIIKGKDATDVAKFAPAKQLIGIFKSYKDITGAEMSDTQKDYIKTLNSKQLSNILYTLNIARKTLVA
jgi:hypothetical protein